MASNFVVSIALGTSLQNLWGAINILQVEYFMGMIAIRHPANLDDFFLALSEMLNINLISLFEDATFDQNEAYITDNEYFSRYGFDSNVHI
jgi:hypothetical protein